MTTCLCTLGCSTQCCPEPIDVVINQYDVTSSGFPIPVLTFTKTSDTLGTLSIEVQDPAGGVLESRFDVTIWFENDDTFTGITSLVPPSTPGNTISVQTDADGTKTLAVGHSGGSSTWYCYARVGGAICSSPVEITVGVVA